MDLLNVVTRVQDLNQSTSPKVVRFYDTGLGIAQSLVVALSVFYIIIWKCVGDLGYIKFMEPQGTVHVEVREPTKVHCHTDDIHCQDDFSPLSTLSYCCDAGDESCHFSEDGSPRLRCHYRDALEVVTKMDQSISLSTRVEETLRFRNKTCKKGSPSCAKLWDSQKGADTYVPDIERFQIGITHSLALHNGGMLGKKEFKPSLHVSGKNPVQHSLCTNNTRAFTKLATYDHHDPQEGDADGAPCYIRPYYSGMHDWYTLDELLKAAGITLDERLNKNNPKTVRYMGAVLHLNVDYNNTKKWLGLQNRISCEYSLDVMKGVDHHAEDLVKFGDLNQQLVMGRHGVRFTLRTRGKVGTLESAHLLLTITPIISLLACGQCLISYIGKHCSRRHEMNRQALGHIFKFDRVDHLQLVGTEDLLRILRANGLPEHGDRSHHIMEIISKEAGEQEEVVREAMIEYSMKRAGIETSDDGITVTR